MALLPSPAGQPNLHGNGGATPPTRRRIPIDRSACAASASCCWRSHARKPTARSGWRTSSSSRSLWEAGPPRRAFGSPAGQVARVDASFYEEHQTATAAALEFRAAGGGAPHGGALGRRPCVVDGICATGGPRRRAAATPGAGRAARRVVTALERKLLKGSMAPSRIKMLEELGVTAYGQKLREKTTRERNFDLLARYVTQHKKEPSRRKWSRASRSRLAWPRRSQGCAAYLPERAAKLSQSDCVAEAGGASAGAGSKPSWTWPGPRPSRSRFLRGQHAEQVFTEQNGTESRAPARAVSSCVHRKETTLQGRQDGRDDRSTTSCAYSKIN